MEQNFDTHTIKEQLKTITENRLFNKSPRLINLITFLVEESLKGTHLKEDIIGIEVFDADYSSSKNDGLVRVYMHKLRKKLDTYYAEDGKNAPILFVLEKGSYKVKFTKPSDVRIKTPKDNRTSSVKNPYSLKKLLLFIIPLILITGIIAHSLNGKDKLYLWDSFMSKNASNFCVLADQVVVQRKCGNIGELHTIAGVNSTEDFVAHIEKNNIDSLQKPGYTFYTKAIPHSIYKLANWFFKHDSEFATLAESEFKYAQSKRNNIIYVGQQKTMSISKEIFLRNSKIFETERDYFIATKDGNKKEYRPKYKNDIQSEYAMVSFMQLNNGNNALYFVSDNDIGTMALVNNFTNVDYLKSFYKKLPSEASYFNALFKVEGVERTDATCELVELEIIE